MFTGIIEAVGKIQNVEQKKSAIKALISTPFKDLQVGESVAVDGVCLTVTEPTPKGEAIFFLSEETLSCSTFRKWEAGMSVNLERALKLESRLSGHLVQGHVDTIATVLNISALPDQHKITLALDPKYGRYCIEKGSIAVNGVSLTINTLQETKNGEFMISLLLIPHSWKNTSFPQLKIGDQVNIEVDMMGKYVERLCQHYMQPLSN